jgi:hypothetical protein
MTRRFVDWAITKKWISIDEEYPENEVYLEAGCPKYGLMQLIEQGSRIFVCDGKDTNKLRKEMGLGGSDEDSAKVIRELFYKEPSSFIEFTRPQQAVFAREFIMSKYGKFTKILAGIRNRAHSMGREFGPGTTYDEVIKILGGTKRELLEQVKPFLMEELSLVNDIKGINMALIAQTLTMHPNKFKTKSGYLKYLGFYDRRRFPEQYKKRNRTLKSVYWFMATEVMKHRDPVFRPIYDKFKDATSQKTCSSCWNKKCGKRKEDGLVCKGQAHRVALNRVATKLAEHFWEKLHNVRSPEDTEFAENSIKITPRRFNVGEWFV